MNKMLKIVDEYIKQGIFWSEAINIILSRLSLHNPKLTSNRELKNMGKDKRAFLLATGPSIKNQDLSLLVGEDCFSVSNFFLHKDIDIIKPRLHFFAPYHKPLVLDNFIENWINADRRLPSETNIVLGLPSKKMVEEYNLFPKRKIYYLDFRSLKYVQNDIEKSILAPQTGPIMIMPVLGYMGYTRINLVGCDMNMLKDYGNNVENFYEKDPRENATDKGRWQGIVYEMEANLIMMKQYKMYYDYFKRRGVVVQNLSPISWIDFVPKIDYYDEVIIGKENGNDAIIVNNCTNI